MARKKTNSLQKRGKGTDPGRADYPMATIMRIIDDAKRHPMSQAEAEALDAELRAFGAKQAKKLGIKERDIVRIIHESRARRRTPQRP